MILAREARHLLGGAGNVVRYVESLGGEVWCDAVVGEGETRVALEEQLRGSWVPEA